MFTKVSVLVPTRKRPDRLLAMIASFVATTNGLAELVFRVDDDDTETVDLLRTYRTVVGPRLNGYASMPQFFNELAGAASGDVLMLGNDDIVFQTEGWDTMILDAANAYQDGLFNFGVTTHNEANFPLSIVSKRVVEVLGFLYDPRVFWGDIFLRDVMSAFGRAIPLSHVRIDHEWMGAHPDTTFRDGDAVRRSDWMAHHQEAVDDAVRRLRAV